MTVCGRYHGNSIVYTLQQLACYPLSALRQAGEEVEEWCWNDALRKKDSISPQ